VAVEDGAPQQPRVSRDEVAGDEEGRMEVEPLEKIEELGGAVGGGAAVEGQGDPWSGIANQVEVGDPD